MLITKEKMQEQFDVMYLNLVKQGRPCVDEYGMCTYRGPTGNKCAVGFIIDDDLAEIIEGNTVSDLNCEDFDGECETKVGEFLNSNNIDFLQDMQNAHDWPFFREGKEGHMWLEKFRENANQVASKYGLRVPNDEVKV